jgi:hypothetical protein
MAQSFSTDDRSQYHRESPLFWLYLIGASLAMHLVILLIGRWYLMQTSSLQTATISSKDPIEFVEIDPNASISNASSPVSPSQKAPSSSAQLPESAPLSSGTPIEPESSKTTIVANSPFTSTPSTPKNSPSPAPIQPGKLENQPTGSVSPSGGISQTSPPRPSSSSSKPRQTSAPQPSTPSNSGESAPQPSTPSNSGQAQSPPNSNNNSSPSAQPSEPEPSSSPSGSPGTNSSGSSSSSGASDEPVGSNSPLQGDVQVATQLTGDLQPVRNGGGNSGKSARLRQGTIPKMAVQYPPALNPPLTELDLQVTVVIDNQTGKVQQTDVRDDSPTLLQHPTLKREDLESYVDQIFVDLTFDVTLNAPVADRNSLSEWIVPVRIQLLH